MSSNITDYLDLQELSWNDVQDEVSKVNSVFADLMCKLKPPKKFSIFKAVYPYGAKILYNGVFHLPLKQGGILPITSPEVSVDIKNKLGYSVLPISLILENTCEVYAESGGHCTPFRICRPGETFGTWEIFESEQAKLSARYWDISAGARTVMLLPKIAVNSLHNKLRAKYEFNLPTPKYLVRHNEVFSKLAQHHAFPEKWQNVILFFSKEWLEQSSDFAPIWSAFNYYLLKEAWQQTLFLRNHIGIAFIWQSLAAEMERMSTKPRNYIVETIKKLVMIGLGTELAFAPATDSSSLPLRGVQAAYVRDYKLDYIPTVMQPSYLNVDKNLPVYYSLQFPTLLQYPPEYDNSRSAMQDLEVIKQLLDALQVKLQRDNLGIYDLIKHLRFDYYHTEKDAFRVMHLTDTLSQEDPRFAYHEVTNTPLDFAHKASFLRGCIKISTALMQ